MFRCGRHAVRRGFSIVLTGLLLVQGASSKASDVCFSEAARKVLPFEVMHQAPPPPVSRAQPYRFEPITASVTGDMGSLRRPSRVGVKRYYFLWANRCHAAASNAQCGWNPKGNLTPGRSVRVQFSSYDRADDCTLLQAAMVLSDDRAVRARFGHSGNHVRAVRDLATAGPGADGTLVDTCIVDDGPAAHDLAGVVVDYEVQDGRSPERTTAFLRNLSQLIRSLRVEAVLFTNPLTAFTQSENGLDRSNLPSVFHAFDRFSVLARGGGQVVSANEVRRQLEMIPKDRPDKIIVTVELAGLTLQNAAHLRKIVVDGGYFGTMIWRNYAQLGGACDTPANRSMACLVFGGCDER